MKSYLKEILGDEFKLLDTDGFLDEQKDDLEELKKEHEEEKAQEQDTVET